MAEDYILPEGKLDRYARRRMPEDSAPGVPSLFEKFFRVFIIAAVICLGAEFIWLLGITPFRPFSKIEINGYTALSRDEILAAAGISGTSSYFSTNAQAAEKALAALSSVESVWVLKQFPDRLSIVLTSRRAVASALVTVNGRSVPVLLDSDGVVFQVGWEQADDSLLHLLPVISGLVIDDPVPGMKLPVMFNPLFRELAKIETSAPELLAAVSELRINPKPFDGFDLILYPVYRKVKVRIPELNEDLLRYTLLMVDVLAAKDPGIDTLDFRGNIASYIPKEATP